MLRYFKFHEHVFAPEPAKETYVERAPGKGWPEQCPPIRQANAFGWDILSAFDLAFVKDEDGGWGLEADHALECDFAPESGDDDEEPAPYLTQHAAWFWDPEQRLPHPISPHVFEAIRHQVKVSSFLFLETDPGEVLLVTEVPNRPRPYRAVTALIETDWYPASYPWHGVLELSPAEDRIEIPRGEPLFRLIPLRRDTYFARPLSEPGFTDLFLRSQAWLARHGRGAGHGEMATDEDGAVDIRNAYRRLQAPSRFLCEEPNEPD